MGRPRRISDEQLDAAARAVFQERGAAAPLSAVAERLGVSTAAVLHRVGSKAGLLQRALAPPVPVALTRLEAPPGPNPRRELEDLLVELARALDDLVPSLIALRSSGVMPPPAQAPTVVLRRALARWLGPLKPRVVPVVAAESLLGTLEARAFNRYVGGASFAPGSDRAFVRKLVGALV